MPTCAPVEASSNTTPAKIASFAAPWRSTVMLFIVTSPSLPAVSVKLVNGMRFALSGARPFIGWIAAETETPVPGVGVGVGVGLGVVPQTAAIAARVIGDRKSVV